ncbi:hypothetical protein DAEQUDRAFT_721272 [Daedalea quercina L-15889]|uniref:Uncharacterized protein n=1 Tax=Daedalea quercina L-15889 TaxID=1314783 RepID=A0A165TQR2_9APHY|nr:hypothetical protein DAEQUDRAFT_721272 [Daedalea quercina L-15889]
MGQAACFPICLWSMFPARTCQTHAGPREASPLDYPPSYQAFLPSPSARVRQPMRSVRPPLAAASPSPP